MIVADWSKYAPEFKESEFRCSATGDCFMQAHFMDTLQEIRREYGKPMVITSGYRSRRHPIEAKKNLPGEHTYGCCADVAVSGADALRLLQIALKHGISRIGVKQDNRGTEFLHLGVGAPGLPNPSLWSYPT